MKSKKTHKTCLKDLKMSSTTYTDKLLSPLKADFYFSFEINYTPIFLYIVHTVTPNPDCAVYNGKDINFIHLYQFSFDRKRVKAVSPSVGFVNTRLLPLQYKLGNHWMLLYKATLIEFAAFLCQPRWWFMITFLHLYWAGISSTLWCKCK